MIAIIVVISFILDLISKMIVVKYISLGENVKIISNFLNMTYVRNTGAAWSIFSGIKYIVLVISLIIIIGIIIYLYKHKINNKLEKVSYGLILGGAFGNLIDRIIHGYVIDFISVRIFNYNYPIFNLADVFIVSGVILLIIYTWRYSRNGDNS